MVIQCLPQCLPSDSSQVSLNPQRHPVSTGVHRLTLLALKLHLLTTQAVDGSLNDPISIDPQLARLSAQFDRAHAKAVQLGLMFWSEVVVGCAGQSYSVMLTPEGVELHSLT